MSRDQEDQEPGLQEYGPELLRELRIQMENDFIKAQIIQAESYVRWLRSREALADARETRPN